MDTKEKEITDRYKSNQEIKYKKENNIKKNNNMKHDTNIIYYKL